jgi:hypothetical protein
LGAPDRFKKKGPGYHGLALGETIVQHDPDGNEEYDRRCVVVGHFDHEGTPHLVVAYDDDWGGYGIIREWDMMIMYQEGVM